MLTGDPQDADDGADAVQGDDQSRRLAGVVGSPIAHSLSPVLHGAAYAALGLSGWRYGRAEVGRGRLAEHVARLGPEWVGLSVTMPGKEEALALAERTTAPARSAGAANTLVRADTGWLADNTDVHGLVAALREVGVGRAPGAASPAPPRRAVITGGGATARSALLALEQLGVRGVELRVRDRARPETQELLQRLDLPDGATVRPMADGIPLDRPGCDVLVGTLPASVPAPALRWSGGAAAVVVDVAYAPWPSPLAAAVRAVTGRSDRVTVVRGTRMLLHQAARQVELMTGRTAPVAAMDAALEKALGEGAR